MEKEDLYKKIMEVANIIATKQRVNNADFIITTEKIVKHHLIQLRKVKIMNLLTFTKKYNKYE